jgi:hypothetical protein
MSTCKSCGAEIVWAVTESGKPIPVNPLDGYGGNLELVTDNRGVTTAVVNNTLKRGYTSHFATCPNAKEHRKPASARAEPRKPKVSLQDIEAAFERNKGEL